MTELLKVSSNSFIAFFIVATMFCFVYHPKELMLCFGPCQEKIRLLKKMITRATRVFQEKWENDLKLLVDARFLIRHFKSESSNYIYRTIPYNYGLVIKNKKEGESSVLDDSVCEGILENCCIPISLLTPLRHYLQVNLNLQITK